MNKNIWDEIQHNQHFYRNEAYSTTSRLRELKSVINYEINELGNNDILSYTHQTNPDNVYIFAQKQLNVSDDTKLYGVWLTTKEYAESDEGFGFTDPDENDIYCYPLPEIYVVLSILPDCVLLGVKDKTIIDTPIN